jgi:hypothetical protein
MFTWIPFRWGSLCVSCVLRASRIAKRLPAYSVLINRKLTEYVVIILDARHSHRTDHSIIVKLPNYSYCTDLQYKTSSTTLAKIDFVLSLLHISRACINNWFVKLWVWQCKTDEHNSERLNIAGIRTCDPLQASEALWPLGQVPPPYIWYLHRVAECLVQWRQRMMIPSCVTLTSPPLYGRVHSGDLGGSFNKSPFKIDYCVNMIEVSLSKTLSHRWWRRW